MNLLDLMRESREKLKPHWLTAVLISVIYGVLVGVPSELNAYGEILSLLLAGPLQLGMSIYFLNIVYNQPATIENLIEGFKPLLRVLLVYLIISIITLFGILLLIVPGIIIALGLSMSYYILIEKPELTIEEVLKESWRLTDGYKLELIVLHLRFIPWYLLGLLCFFVGIFVVLPWHQLTLANYYNYLKEQQPQ
ncbi:DUF975 family protein [Flavobacteriaceae bacterium]|nr:DUF975 family protein [Flavobacteriaceae bacterium]